MIPSVSSQQQFIYTRSRPELWGHIRAFYMGKARFALRPPYNRILASLMEGWADQGLRDGTIYQYLAAIWHDHALPPSSGPRVDNRVVDIMTILGQDIHPTRMLDFGCAEGSISRALARALRLDAQSAFACDLRTLVPGEVNDISFDQIDLNRPLPYPDNSFDLITSLMVLHHVSSIGSTLQDLYRILRPGGLLLIREHDLDRPDLAVFLDLVHGAYGLVLTEPPEDPTFLVSYRAHYRSMNDWFHVIESIGFKAVVTPGLVTTNQRLFERPNPQRFFYALFQR